MKFHMTTSACPVYIQRLRIVAVMSFYFLMLITYRTSGWTSHTTIPESEFNVFPSLPLWVICPKSCLRNGSGNFFGYHLLSANRLSIGA